MWELGLFKRIVPAFVMLVMAAVMYIVVKYAMSGMFAGFNASGQDPSTWGLAYWLLGLMGVWVAWVYILKGWLYITGRNTSGIGESRKPRRKPPIEQFPTNQF